MIHHFTKSSGMLPTIEVAPISIQITLFSCTLILVVILGCGKKADNRFPYTTPTPITPMALPGKTFHQSPEDYNRFAVESYLKIVRGKGDENAVFSPLSLSMALEVLYAGSGGETTRTLESVLHLPKGNNDLPRNPALFEYKPPKKILLDPSNPWLNYGHPPVFLAGNSIWYSDKLTLKRTFETNMKKTLFLETFPVSEAADRTQVASDMEQWVNRVIQGLIPSISPEPPVELSFTLLNTLYFKAFWYHPFETCNSSDRQFTLVSGEKIMTPGMGDEAVFPFMQNEEFRALEMPYIHGREKYDVHSPKDTRIKSNFSMLFILPKTTGDIHTLEEKLTEQMLGEIVRSLVDTRLFVSIPKFRLEQENNLRDIFDDDSLVFDADYSGMFTPSPMTDAISAKQKIVLGIDEHGTEAAVVTEMMYVSLGSDPPIFIVDHPFLFLIRERKSGAILFLGRVMNPNEK